MFIKMTRRSIVRFAAFLAILALVPKAGVLGAAEHPNLILIFPDQWRGQALGFLGEESVKTPNLDRLASESLVLTEAVSNYPVCSPYRAMLLTGKYPHTNGVLSNCNSKGTEWGYELRAQDRCWSDVLHDHSYSLGYIGKWHLEAPRKPFVESYNNSEKFAWNEWTPPKRRHGFDFWYAYNTYDRHLHPLYWSSHAERDAPTHIDQWGPEHEADMAIRFIRNEQGHYRSNGKPFCLVVAMNPPHMPYQQVPGKYVDRYQNQTADALLEDRPDLLPAETKMGKYTRRNIKYQYAMMTGIDEQVGRILKTLDDQQLQDNTIVLFTSDHGDCLGLHGRISKNNHYELSMRVPMLVRWPGHIQPRHDDLLISTPDIYPTLLELMGFAADIPSEVQGTSYAKLFCGQQMDRPTSQLYIRVPVGQPQLGCRGVRTHRFTLMIERKKDRPNRIVLHDNQNDPYQLENIAGDHADIVKRLVQAQLIPWLKRTGDPWKLGADSRR